jgi:NAD(P)-dependent dehydrogenase (short-subunit alcohol dehydrogenase family)
MVGRQGDGDSGTLGFDGRVAIVTGAGGNPGLGRAYARLLASRGARVVVNDVRRMEAEEVAAEIVAEGGEAVGDGSDIADPAGAEAMIATAVETWGRLDVLVNNAGVVFLAPFEELKPGDTRRIVEVHLLGSLWTCRAAWPHLRESGSGRVVNIGSESMFGHRLGAVYGAAKGGVFALTRSLAVHGAADGIAVNCLLPAAFTATLDRLIEDSESKRQAATQSPDDVAPVLAALAHESCELNGACLAFREGRVWEVFLNETDGARPASTPEAVLDAMPLIRARAGATENTPVLAAGKRTLVPRPYRSEPA